MIIYRCELYMLYTDETSLIYRLNATGTDLPFKWPELELDGQRISAAPHEPVITERLTLSKDIEQITLRGSFGDKGDLTMKLRVCPSTPFIRFCYSFSASEPMRLTKTDGDNLSYLSWPTLTGEERTEVRLSEYNRLFHGYCLRELTAFEHEDELIGPMFVADRGDHSFLVAYEHGSTYPDKFICFAESNGRSELRAIKGNYRHNQSIDTDPLDTIWLQLGAARGGKDDLAELYRAFQLSYCSLSAESRKPYIFYNTWAFQERNKFYNKQQYLTSMTQERIEREIEIAHRMGVDVFVIDTGWFEMTGDWLVNRNRFPAGMEHIHAMLEKRGMKLGLWFGPTSAAIGSEMLRRHENDLTCLEGETPGSFDVWETGESYEMCMVSSYWEDFANRLIKLADELGVRYFKWDGVGMYGCDRADHFHGDEATSAQDRRDCYSFLAGVYLSKVAEKLTAAVPDAIVDMDITEGGRFVGLGFLSVGKYFAINNGPYYQDYDICVPDDVWSNIFVHPGAARTWIMREGLSFDKWIPSVLMMAHYIPDDPNRSQMINIASLLLGQNGIWGDLPGISDEGVALFGEILGVYKTLRDDITSTGPVVYGRPGEALEVYEKINKKNGRGMVAVFTNQNGEYSYRLSSYSAENATVFGSVNMIRSDDAIILRCEMDAPDAAIVFFG